jgi:opacity protein-like surface antigen
MVVIAAAAAALAGAAAPAAANTPRGAPEPQLPEAAPDSEEPPRAEAVAPQPVRRYRPASQYRRGKGWFLGGSLGVGSVTYSGNSISSDSQTATFFDVRLGGMLNERFAISTEFWSDGHRNEFDDSLAVTQNCLGLAMTYWVTPHLWLKSGLGTSRLTMYRGGTELASHKGVGYTVGAGYEIVSRDSLSVDLSLRLLGSSFDTSTDDMGRSALSLHAGIAWY